MSNDSDELKAFIERSNQGLAEAGTSAAESAFGLGCSLGTIALLVMVTFLFFIFRRDWVLLAIVALVGAIIGVAFSVQLAIKARSATVKGTYTRVVDPQIEDYLHHSGITRQDFDQLANQTLAHDAPLRKFTAHEESPKTN